MLDGEWIEGHIVLRENRNMLALGKKLGFDIKREPDSGDKELVIHFRGKRTLIENKNTGYSQ